MNETKKYRKQIENACNAPDVYLYDGNKRPSSHDIIARWDRRLINSVAGASRLMRLVLLAVYCLSASNLTTQTDRWDVRWKVGISVYAAVMNHALDECR